MLSTTNADKTQTIVIEDIVIVQESDAPEYSATVIDIQKDENYGDSVKILRHVNRSPYWVSSNRIVRHA